MLDVLDIINIVAIVMIALIIPFSLWLAYFRYRSAKAAPKDYPEAAPHRIAVLICARNEAVVIRQSVESFKAQEYPKDKFEVFVVAHNCTDDTAEIAKASGAHVIIHNDPGHRRKADAINAGINYINGFGESRAAEGKQSQNYDYLVIFDADGVAEPDYFEQMNRALSAGADIAQEYIIPGNFDTNIISKLAGLLYMQLMASNAIGLDRAGLPVTLYGCGFAMRMELISKGWHTRTLVEDFESMVLATLAGKKIVLADKAKASADMPISLRIALRQRRRWTMGDAQCTKLYIKDYLRNLRRLGMPGVKVTIELLMIPLMILLGYGVVLELILIALRGISRAALIIIISAIIVIYLTISISACSALRKYGRTIKGNMAAVLLSPLWASVMVIFAMQSPFVRDVEWKEIPRSGDNPS